MITIPERKILNQVKNDFYEQGYQDTQTSYIVNAHPIQGYRIMDIIYLEKNDIQYSVTILCKGYFKHKNIIVGEPRLLTKTDCFKTKPKS